jgi:hypothetical protein
VTFVYADTTPLEPTFMFHELGHEFSLDHSFSDEPAPCALGDGRPGAYCDFTDIMSGKAWSRQRVEENVAIGQAYLEGRGPFPERLAVILLTATFMSDFARLVGDWAEWAESVVAAWPSDLSKAKADMTTLTVLVDKDRAAVKAPGP